MKAILSILCLFALVSCSNDDVVSTLGRWDSVEQFAQRFESMSNPNDDHSWVQPDNLQYAYIEDDQMIRSAEYQDEGGPFIFKKMVNGKLYGIISAFLSTDWYAFPLQYTYDTQTKELISEDKENFYLEKSTGNTISFSKSLGTFERDDIIYNGILSTYTTYTINPESKIIWFDSMKDAIKKYYGSESNLMEGSK